LSVCGNVSASERQNPGGTFYAVPFDLFDNRAVVVTGAGNTKGQKAILEDGQPVFRELCR
jgi:hypothetical protein